MKQHRLLLILVGLLVAIILAFFLKDVVRQAVVTPFAYLWWALALVYSAIPQVVLWILLLAVIILSLITSLLTGYSRERAYEEPPISTQGPVEILAGWISNSVGEGNYYKWMIANRLGKLASELSGRAGNRGFLAGPQEKAAPGRIPSEAVQRYLKAGLKESFADYPLPSLPFMHRKPTPFDLDVQEAVEFLESQMDDH